MRSGLTNGFALDFSGNVHHRRAGEGRGDAGHDPVVRQHPSDRATGRSAHGAREPFAQKFGFEKPLTHQEVIFYCRSGVRSTSACDIAKRNGYTK